MDKKKSNLETLRHSTAHVLAAAVLQMFPEAKFGTGPAIENGFYYDFDLPRTLIPEDLPILEEKMREIIKADHKFEEAKISAAEAEKDFRKLGQDYKLELIEDLKKSGEQICVYRAGAFVDLCAGPHVASTKDINPDAFSLTKISGAYWKADEKNPQMQRIYGVVFESKDALKEYLQMIAEAEKRDHRKIGKDLDLFSFHNEGHGFAFWHPKGMVLREALMQPYDILHKSEGYQTISTPMLLSEEMWHKSGHWDNYKDNMYFTKIENKSYAIKPMNCPGSILIYNTHPRSYKEFPLKYSEKGEVHRHEPSGTLHGLFRVRAFRQDDAHIFALETQIEEELKQIVNLTINFYKIFNFPNVDLELSTRPKKSIGTDEIWNQAEVTMKKTLDSMDLKYKINEGDGAFYGPKIDFHIKDSIGRSWQCGTVQLDFSMPERFDLKYIDNEGKFKRPVMIHRTVFGSIQRFIGILIEHYAGAFPVWLSPVQAMVIPVSEEKFGEYAKSVKTRLLASGVRVELDSSAEGLGKKIRDAEKQKIPYMLVVGEKEMTEGTVAVRKRADKNQEVLKVDEFVEKILKEIQNKQ